MPRFVERATARTGLAATTVAAAVSAACHANGLLTPTCGTFGNMLRFLPPLLIPSPLVAEAPDVLDDAMATAG